MNKLTLAKSFCERWLAQVGNWPTVEAVRHFLARSVKVQPCMDLYRKDGKPFRVLAVYWNPELDLVMKVDTTHQVAVTVFSTENWQCEGKKDVTAPAAGKAQGLRSGGGNRVAAIREIFSFRTMAETLKRRKYGGC